jgi:hypothetical protein
VFGKDDIDVTLRGILAFSLFSSVVALAACEPPKPPMPPSPPGDPKMPHDEQCQLLIKGINEQRKVITASMGRIDPKATTTTVLDEMTKNVEDAATKVHLIPLADAALQKDRDDYSDLLTRTSGQLHLLNSAVQIQDLDRLGQASANLEKAGVEKDQIENRIRTDCPVHAQPAGTGAPAAPPAASAAPAAPPAPAAK